MTNDCCLILDDGFSLSGRSFGASAPSIDDLERVAALTAPRALGEVVFVTAMSGYHELLTDPSYTGQIVALTYPHAGNYGCAAEWNENESEGARLVSPAGLVTRSVYDGPVPAGRISIDDFLAGHGVPGMTDVDTRSLTLHLRDNGARNGLIIGCRDGVLDEPTAGRALRILKSFPSMEGRDLVGETGSHGTREVNPGGSPHIALLDCGAKENILRRLAAEGCRLTILPADAKPQHLREAGADALFVSNGPGDPAVLSGQVTLISQTIGTMPVLGICLGHQLIARAIGAETYKMTFGHHGINHPVRDRRTGKVFVTSQNHGFAVDEAGLPDGCEVWFENANDGTVEGIWSDSLRLRTTQFHPEAAPGPRDAYWLFRAFLEVLGGGTDAGTH